MVDNKKVRVLRLPACLTVLPTKLLVVFLSGSRSEYCIKDTVHPIRFSCARMGLSPGNHYFAKASLNLSTIAEYLIPSYNYTVKVAVTPYNTHTDTKYKPHSQEVSVVYSPKKKEKDASVMSSRRRTTLLQINATLKSWISSTTQAPGTEILDALDALKLLPVPSAEVLMETQLGLTLRKIKKSSTPQSSSSFSLAASKASEILTLWKKEFSTTKDNDDEVSADYKSKPTRKSQREVKPIQSYSNEVAEKEIQTNKTKTTGIVVYPDRKPIPARNSNNELVFSDFPTFRPNLTPKEVLQAG
eukprot:gene38908-52551_t